MGTVRWVDVLGMLQALFWFLYFLSEIGYEVTKTPSESEGAGDMRRENKKVWNSS